MSHERTSNKSNVTIKSSLVRGENIVRKLFLLLFLIAPISAAYAEDVISGRLEEIYQQYTNAQTDHSENRTKLLIELDFKLRVLIDKPWTTQNKVVGKGYWKKKYLAIGLGVGHYSDTLQYSGELLNEAKELDDAGKFSSYTRYADICGGSGSFSCEQPNPEASLAYVRGYPKGPFIWDALVIAGNFYSDLHEALKENEDKDYKYDCYSRYISKRPIAEQLENARSLAVEFYKKALAIHSGNNAADRAIEEWLSKLENNSEDIGWHYCSD